MVRAHSPRSINNARRSIVGRNVSGDGGQLMLKKKTGHASDAGRLDSSGTPLVWSCAVPKSSRTRLARACRPHRINRPKDFHLRAPDAVRTQHLNFFQHTPHLHHSYLNNYTTVRSPLSNRLLLEMSLIDNPVQSIKVSWHRLDMSCKRGLDRLRSYSD
ncbi:hypothetical protein MPH_00199 [Macrophomina phaseolina MS6]|uniref:Uncharacterized protein n=1 Tax=Macrophomina phaseolina (strain MS6) TaxID=1126212 RepID=K2SJ57_MACPH|nr:hypothetical protein MPH_00199 [Macrophomina phaseolina MS6]